MTRNVWDEMKIRLKELCNNVTDPQMQQKYTSIFFLNNCWHGEKNWKKQMFVSCEIKWKVK